MAESFKGKHAPAASANVNFPFPDVDADIYSEMESGKSSLQSVMESIGKGKAVVEDAVLFCGRFNRDGRLMREGRGKPYRMVRVRSHKEFAAAQAFAESSYKELVASIEAREAKARRAAEAKRGVKVKREAWPFVSNSDVGSTFELDPNQFSEYTPYFSGPWGKQQYFDYFKGHARAFQEYTHHPIGKRLVDILVQYAFGRGFKVACKNKDVAKKWRLFEKQNRITHKMRKYWMREYLIYGENFIDKLRWVSVDPSTIYDIVCEGYGEFIDQVLYYQQMFQTATQMYAGISVPGVPKSGASKMGRYIIRQIPFDQIIHIKANVVSIEKRGRSILFPILGWLKRITDTLNAQVLGEQLRASFVWDDTIKGDQSDVDAHAQRYNYIPVAPTLFVHNESVERKPLQPMANITAGASNIVSEIIALCATCLGIQKEQLNVMASGGGSRAMAIVGNEPFTKVIEDLQEDGSDLTHQIIECFCIQNKIEYNEDEWQVIFPAVQKDATLDRIKANMLLASTGYFSDERLANMLAADSEMDNYDYWDEQKKIGKDQTKRDAMGVPGEPRPAPPDGRFGGDDEPDDNPIHGAGKKKIVAQHRSV